ncbi:carboxypeptidase regulatory-like domain-containing protein [Paenibacillus sp. CMM36]
MSNLFEKFRLITMVLLMLFMMTSNNSGFVYASSNEISASNPSHQFINVAADSLRSYAVKSDGTVWSWGSGLNERGELVGYPNFVEIPVKIPNVSEITKVVGGMNSFQLALKSDGTVWSWGYNSEGQLGDGTNTYRSKPVMIHNLHDVISISAGSHHSLALKSDGTVWTWGYNAYGILGDGSYVDQYTPVQVKNLSNVISITGSYEKSKAVKSDGTVWEWGYLVNGSNYQTTPTQILGIENVKALANISTLATLALKADGTVWVWDDYRSTPTQVENLDNIVAISNGMALKSDGKVVLIKEDIFTNQIEVTPVELTDVTQISKTYAQYPGHQLAIKKDGSVWAWGGNDYGQLGDGTLDDKLIPVEVNFPGDELVHSVTGSVYGIEGMPVEYATVTASTYNQSWTVTTDVYGKYTLLLPSEIYTLSVYADGYVDNSKSNVSVTSSAYDTFDFNLVGYGGFVKLVFKDTDGKALINPMISIKRMDNSTVYSGVIYGKDEWVYPLGVGTYNVTIGEVTRLVDVELNKLYIFDPMNSKAGSVIKGKVSGVDGYPVEQATVIASTYNQLWTATTDVYGEYTLSVPSGKYTLNAFANGYIKSSKSDVSVTSSVYETADFNLVGYGGFVKFVFKDAEGKPLSNPYLSIRRADNTFTYSGIVYGKDEWIYPLSVGEYDITIGEVTRRINVKLNELLILNPADPN